MFNSKKAAAPAPKNTLVDFELETGEHVKLTLAFYLLLGLKSCRKDIYERYNKIQSKGAKEECEAVFVLYAAYMCAYIQEHGCADGAMSEEEFMIGCGSDRIAVAEATRALLDPKSKAASATRS